MVMNTVGFIPISGEEDMVTKLCPLFLRFIF